jgi:very-short-patch-repair endonuclease
MRDDEEISRPRAKKLRKAMTKAEVVVWTRLQELNKRGYKFRRQHPIGPYIADVAHIRGKLVVEIDGVSHWTAERAEHDKRRDAFMASQGWNVLRLPDTDVYRDVAAVVDDIVRRLPLT